MTQDSSQAGPRAPQSRRRRRRGRPAPAGRGLAWAAAGLAVAAVLASGYIVYESEIKPRLAAAGIIDGGGADIDGGGDTVDARLETIEKRLRAHADAAARVDARLDAVAAQRGRLDATDATVAALDARLQALQTADAQRERAVRELSVTVAAVRAEAARLGNAEAWRLAEAEHLLVIANQRLRLGGDAALARRALWLADDILRQAADPAYATVRARIAEEITALDQAAPADAAGVLRKLAALAAAVEELPLAGDALAGFDSAAMATSADATAPETPAAAESTAGESENPSTGWLAAGKNLLSDLGALVQVETIDAEARPVLSAELRAAIYANARLILEAAQLAFLRGDEAVYAERM
ncbi:MAG: uroporphyrinogen-III C-methyltransferase, partial [Gammaproteobacteria bacterium]|nr:uroporphyrinogen-III C-methyltransferase [Gammaproteobacteria bacterium]